MKNNNNRIEVFCVKQVVFGISLSVIKVLFSLSDYSLSCSKSDRLARRLRILIIGLLIYLNVLNNFQ